MKILVCGGRDFGHIPTERAFIYASLNELNEKYAITEVVTGGANGVDTFALWWATNHGKNRVAYPANWRVHGRAAGMIRNKEMLQRAKPDLVVAFPGGVGTANMVSLAKKANVQVIQKEFTE